MRVRELTPVVAPQVAAAVALGFFYGGDLVRYLRSASAEVAWLVERPSLPLTVAGCAAFALVLGAGGWGLARGRAADWRGFRLGLVVTIGVFFVDFVVVSSARSPVTREDYARGAVAVLAEGAAALATPARVPDDVRQLEALVGDVLVPFFVRGERVPRWTVSVRRGCEGPASDAAGAGPATLVYCVARGGKRAWVTLVGLPLGQTYGAPAVVSTGAPWVATVEAAPAPPPEPEAPEPPVWGAPTPQEPPVEH